jgi:diguanylate cyclase (GGDEF)-like protein
MTGAVSAIRQPSEHSTRLTVAGVTEAHRAGHPLMTAVAEGALDDLPVAVVCFAGGLMVGANARWSTLSGLDASASVGDGWLTVVHPDDRHNALHWLQPSDPAGEVDLRLVRDGYPEERLRACWRVLNATDPPEVVVTFTDVGEPGDNEARLLHRSTHDEMTSLANRGHLMAMIRGARLARRGLAAMLFLDLDGFKTVNDRLGHRVGDEVLMVTSRRIASTIRSTDFAGRLGGDEIGVFCPAVRSRTEVFGLAERLGRAVNAPIAVGDDLIVIAASIGIAFSPDGVSTAEELLEQAARAMYRAKAGGGARWATSGDDRIGRAVAPIDLSEPLHATIGSVVTIATAVGMLAEATGRDIADAEAHLRSFATAHELPVIRVAELVVAHEIELDSVIAAP